MIILIIKEFFYLFFKKVMSELQLLQLLQNIVIVRKSQIVAVRKSIIIKERWDSSVVAPYLIKELTPTNMLQRCHRQFLKIEWKDYFKTQRLFLMDYP